MKENRFCYTNQRRVAVMLMKKHSLISPKYVEDFYQTDRGNIIFWLDRLEKYSPERVKAACLRAGADDKTAGEIAAEVDKYADSRIKMSEVRPLIFNLLQKKDPKAAKKFRAGEVYVRTSGEVFERFDKNRITVSLIKETNLDEKTAERIAAETEVFLKKANLNYMSSPLIREIVNVKLVENGLEKERKLYTRVGMPVFDLENLIKRGSKENANLQYNPETIHKLIADQSSKQYALTRLLPIDLADAHMNGEIHIHDLDYFPYRPFCFSHDARFFMKTGFKPDGTGLHTSVAGPAKHPKVLILHLAKALAAAQTNFGGGQGFSYFNTFLAPVVSGLTDKEIKQIAQMFVYEMSQTYIARGGQVVFSSIDLDMHVPELFRDIPAFCLGGKTKGTYADYEDETNKFFNAFLDVYLEGDYRGKPFNFPKFELQIYPKELNNNDEDLLKVSKLAAKFGTPYYIINQPYMPKFACYQSMPFDEKILLIKNNNLTPVKIGDYIDFLMEKNKIEKENGLEGEIELANSNDYVISFNTKTLEVEKKKITKVMRHKNKEKIFKLTLDGNRTISATQKHKIHAVRNNKIIELRFEDIKKGDFIVGLKNLNIKLDFDSFLEFKDKKLEIDCDLARLLGYFASEGYIHIANKKNRMNKLCFSFNTKEKDYINDVCNILKNKFSKEPKLDISIKNNTTTVYIYDKQLVELFVNKLKTGTDAHTKRVPMIVFSFSHILLKEFLLGMFRGDGYYGKNIDLHLCNKNLVEDIFLLNLRLGIPFEFLEYRGKFDSYAIRLTSQSRVKQFLDFVSFSKTDGGLPKKTFDFYERIPTKPFNIKRKNLKVGHWNRCQIEKRITTKRLKIEDNLYSKFIKSDLHLFEVKKIEEVKSKYVYDLVDVERNHNFSNIHGLFSSNCCSFLMPLGDSSSQSDIENGTIRGGSLQVITINLPQIAYEANGDDNKLFEIIDDRLEKAKKIMLLRYKIIEENLKNDMLPFLSQKINEDGERYLEPKKQSYTIGIVGINEMLKYHTGEELHESMNAWKFGLKVMKYLKNKVGELREETGLNFALARTPAESCAARLASIDRKRYGKKAVMQGDGDSAYYTNSFHVRPNSDIPLFKRMQIEGAFHALTSGGAMSHIWLGEANPDPEAILSMTKKLATKTAIQYMAFTKDLTICNSCNFVVGGLLDSCPNCAGKDIQQLSRITGYYQNIAGWNNAKKQELKDRRRYDV